MQPQENDLPRKWTDWRDVEEWTDDAAVIGTVGWEEVVQEELETVRDDDENEDEDVLDGESKEPRGFLEDWVT